MNDIMIHPPTGDTLKSRILGQVNSRYVRAHSAILEDGPFEVLSSVILSITRALSDLLMPMCEYPRLIQQAADKSSTVSELAEKITLAADRLYGINRHLIRLCQGITGPGSEVDMDLLVRGILADMAEQGNIPSPIRITLETDGQPALLHAPLDALYHLVRDMCLNALASMGDGGQLTVRIGNVDIVDSDVAHGLGVPSAEYLCLQFVDTGPGIDENCSNTLFDPFVSTATGEGFGLGLCSVYRTILHFKGRILYRPFAGSGADFILFIPKEST